MQLSKNQKIFAQFFLMHFRNLQKILNTLHQKMSLRRYLFLKPYIAKRGVTQMAKKPRVRTLMGSQQVKGWKALLKSARQYLCPIFWSLSNKIISKNSVLVLSGIWTLFVNILTPNEKYSHSVKGSL